MCLPGRACVHACVHACMHKGVSAEEKGSLVMETLQAAIAMGKSLSKILCRTFVLLSVGATLSHRNPSSWGILSYSIPRLFPAEGTRGSQKN